MRVGEWESNLPTRRPVQGCVCALGRCISTPAEWRYKELTPWLSITGSNASTSMLSSTACLTTRYPLFAVCRRPCCRRSTANWHWRPSTMSHSHWVVADFGLTMDDLQNMARTPVLEDPAR